LPVKSDTVPLVSDSLTIKNDTLNTLKNPADSTKAEKGDIEFTIYYSADDSINSNLTTKIIRLYGNAKIKYGQIELEADEIEIDYQNSTLSAHGSLDSAGRRVGFPVFKDGSQTYETKDMTYNFKTKKAKITEVVTKQGDGFLHGDAVFKNERNELFSVTNAYTTCNLPVPHFRILSHHSKAIPGDKIVSGPFYMEFNGVPTPLGFAFGLFPSKQKSASGLIIPKYGEEGRRGFFLKNGGYFFDINDYIKLSVTGDVYSKGSSALYLNTTYRNRYKYSGNFNFTFTNNRLTDKVEDKNTSKDFRLTWSHSPQTKGTGRFSASVNAATTKFNSNNLLGVNAFAQTTRIDNTTRKLASNISYSKTFRGTPMSMGINLRHSQDLKTGRVDLPVPDVSFNVNNIYPFKKSDKQFLQNVSIRLTSTGTNQLTNDLGLIGKLDANKIHTDSIAPFSFKNIPIFFQNAKKGIRHTIPLSTSIKVLKNFTLSPSLNYDELWYFEKLNWVKQANAQGGSTLVAKDTSKGFNRVSNYNGSVGMTTRLYGMYVNKNRESRLKAIRHVINPSINYTYQPDFGDAKYGYYQTFDTVKSSKDATPVTIQKSAHEGFIYGSSRTGKSSSVGFSINNNLEMKMMGKKDTVARKISLLNTLSVGSSYNFAADSMKLAPFAFSANTNVLNDKLNINMSSTVDPYQYWITKTDEKTQAITQVRVDRYAWQNGGGFKLGQISAASLALSTNLSPKGKEKDKETRDKIGKSEMSPTDKEFLLKNPDAYIDFNIPWNLRLSYNIDYSKSGHLKSNITQALRFNGDFSLSQKWKIIFNSGYDFQAKKLTQSSVSLSRELHCWQMSLNWVPFGKFQSYSFSIGIKSSILQSLKLDRQRSFTDN
jgi:lipopolysaccharide assembly outer membrane protein LptD (OstA)